MCECDGIIYSAVPLVHWGCYFLANPSLYTVLDIHFTLLSYLITTLVVTASKPGIRTHKLQKCVLTIDWY